MDTAIKVLIALIIFMFGYSLGQGHAAFDISGDRGVNGDDVHSLIEKILPGK